MKFLIQAQYFLFQLHISTNAFCAGPDLGISPHRAKSILRPHPKKIYKQNKKNLPPVARASLALLGPSLYLFVQLFTVR